MTARAPWWADRIPPEARRTLRPYAAAIIRRAPGRRPRWGNLKRSKPFSAHYGFDRGQPVDRRYIERFLGRMADRIRGDVLEVRSSDYTRRFGSVGVRSHVIDIDPSNDAATIVGDLCHRETLRADSYDCVILTQTLQYLDAPDAALTNLWCSLRAGGVMLITVPCTARIDHESPESDYWRWTPAGLRRLIEENCGDAAAEIESGGNLVAALAVMLGLAFEDLSEGDLADDDPVFPIIACAAVTKALRLWAPRPGRPGRTRACRPRSIRRE
jgi:SAM-dependent methyltransferase